MRINRNKLNLALANKCMSLTDLRQVGKMSSNTLSRIRNNPDFSPSPKTIGRIARVLEVPVEQLIEVRDV